MGSWLGRGEDSFGGEEEEDSEEEEEEKEKVEKRGWREESCFWFSKEKEREREEEEEEEETSFCFWNKNRLKRWKVKIEKQFLEESLEEERKREICWKTLFSFDSKTT